jgi:predicted nucleotidyltransferase component of viral defense system
MFLFEHPDFKALITQVASKRSIPEAIVEKDYWVTYVLHRLGKSEFAGKYVFKGGTSLSKGWKLLDRFSEDIDLLFLSDDIDSSKQFRKRLKKVRDYVSELPGLEFDEGNPDNTSSNEARVSCFRYPNKSGQTLLSLAPTLKLEMGYRGGAQPAEVRKVQSYLGEELGLVGQSNMAEDVDGIDLLCLHPRRTFVEKLFALHDAYESGKAESKVRHYYDVYQLLSLDEVDNFLGTSEFKKLKDDVAQFSKENFPNSVLPKENEFKSSKAFSPSPEMKTRISKAHDESDLFFGKKPGAKEILERISKFRERF